MNLLQDTLGRKKGLYWKLRQEIILENTEVFGSTLLANDKVYDFPEDPGIISLQSFLSNRFSCLNLGVAFQFDHLGALFSSTITLEHDK